MRIVNGKPPIFDEVDRAFHIAGQPIVFAWGDVIYNPEGVTVSDHLIAHEAVHGKRQGRDILGWWHRYIDDPEFRLQEEILAHIEEYSYLINGANRASRRRALKRVSTRLGSKLYGGLITSKQAARILDQWRLSIA